jgi:polyphosphate glucokinase
MGRMGAGKKAPPPRVLVIDIGGSHVKFRIAPRGELFRFVSGPKLAPGKMVRRLLKQIARSGYDLVSIGYPGLIHRGRIIAEPYNLGPGWVGFDFQAAFGRPVRLINDAAMQAAGSYRGGRMLFVGLGTGLGVTMILDGLIEPMEMGHLPYKHGRTFEDWVGERGRARLGTKRWRAEVPDVLEHLRVALEADYGVVGGGNVKRLRSLPEGFFRGDNENAFVGGLRIWQSDDPLGLTLPALAQGFPRTLRRE